MSNRAATRYPSVLQALSASVGLAGATALGCTGGDEPLQVSSNTAPSVLQPQTPLDGATIPKYVDRLPTLSGNRIDGTRAVAVDMHEFQQKLLPGSVYAGLPAPFNAGTFMWGYQLNGGQPQFPSQTIEARQGAATSVTYANRLQGRNGAPPFLQKYLTQDLTIHWADPTHVTANNHCANSVTLAPACLVPSMEPIPTVPHLHGAEVLSAFDGHPTRGSRRARR
jgi:spore coat protein A